MTPAARSTPAPRRLLVRGVNWLGDAVMTTPALQRLREALPEAHIALLTHQKLADLWQHHPSLDAVIPFATGEGPWSVARRLRTEGFQAALVLPNSPRSALEVWLARVPRRIGYARSWRTWLLTQRVAPRPGQVRMPKRSAGEVKRLVSRSPDSPPLSANRAPNPLAHQLHDYLHLAATLEARAEPLPPLLAVTPADIQQAEDIFVANWRAGLPSATAGKPLILLALNPGAEYGPAKRWPAERFAAVAREVSRQLPHCAWIAFGTEKDHELCAAIARLAGNRMLNLAGRTSLRQLMALLKVCRAALTNDSGPMHVAAALGTPVVVPFGSTSPELTGPGLPGDPRQQLLTSFARCSPCFRRTCPIDFRCMTGITQEQVVQAVFRAIAPK